MYIFGLLKERVCVCVCVLLLMRLNGMCNVQWNCEVLHACVVTADMLAHACPHRQANKQAGTQTTMSSHLPVLLGDI